MLVCKFNMPGFTKDISKDILMEFRDSISIIVSERIGFAWEFQFLVL